MMEERLSKAIAFTGLASRREADALVREGHVTVNGEVITEPGHRIVLDQDHVKVDGKLLAPPAALVYLIVNKPRGVLCTRADPEGRATVVSLLRGFKGRVMPVGRLDSDSEGLVLLTNDSAMAQVLEDPKSGISRVYLVKVRGVPEEKTLLKLRTGVPLEGGRTLPMDVRVVSITSRNAWLQVGLREARSHLLEWAFAKLRHPLVKVKRLSFGPLSVKGLAPSTFRRLNEEEIKALRKLAENPPGLPSAEQVQAEIAQALEPPEPSSEPVRHPRRKPRFPPARAQRSGQDDGGGRAPRKGPPRGGSRGPAPAARGGRGAKG